MTGVNITDQKSMYSQKQTSEKHVAEDLYINVLGSPYTDIQRLPWKYQTFKK